MFSSVSELGDLFKQVSKYVVIFEDRKYNAMKSAIYHCNSDCLGKIRTKDGVLSIISAHDSNCPTLTQQAAFVASTKT